MPVGAAELAGGELAQLGSTPGEQQSAVQQTPVISNLVSQMTGGVGGA